MILVKLIPPMLALALIACGSSGTTDGGTSTSSGLGSSTAQSGSSSGSPGPTTTAGTSSGSSSSGSCAAQNDCNSLTLGSVVQNQQSPTTAPTPQGGAPTPGVYEVTTITDYTGPGGASGPNGISGAATLQFSATSGSTGTLQEVTTTGKTDDGCTNTNTLFVTWSDAEATTTTTCPASCANCTASFSYTATPGSPPTFLLFIPEADGGVQVDTFTWQHS